MIVAYHAKNDHGWHEVCRLPVDSPSWHEFDRSMIAELIKHNHEIVTCGWNMYQRVTDES